MFTPSGWGTADIDGSGGNGAVQVTPATLYGAPKNLNAQTALDAANTGNVLTIKSDNSISADNTISIWNGMYNVTFTCKASGASGDFEFNKGDNADATAANLHAKINAYQEKNPDTNQDEQVFTSQLSNNVLTIKMAGDNTPSIVSVPSTNLSLIHI